jgi:hypothetical protein
LQTVLNFPIRTFALAKTAVLDSHTPHPYSFDGAFVKNAPKRISECLLAPRKHWCFSYDMVLRHFISQLRLAFKNGSCEK